MLLLRCYAPRPYKTKEEEIIEQNRNSEMISIPAHSTIGMVDSKLQVIDTPARQITNVGAGYLSGTDPVGEFVVGNVVAGNVNTEKLYSLSDLPNNRSGIVTNGIIL